MKSRTPRRALLGLLLAPVGVPPAAAAPDEPRAELPPARDGDIAIRQELEAARRAATLAAYDLFIARHPDHPLAQIARREREVLARRLRRTSDSPS